MKKNGNPLIFDTMLFSTRSAGLNTSGHLRCKHRMAGSAALVAMARHGDATRTRRYIYRISRCRLFVGGEKSLVWTLWERLVDIQEGLVGCEGASRV
jgi:hypothetical protein